LAREVKIDVPLLGFLCDRREPSVGWVGDDRRSQVHGEAGLPPVRAELGELVVEPRIGLILSLLIFW
jgi:hypothetical protein